MQGPVPPVQWTPNVVSQTGSALLLFQKSIDDHGCSRTSALFTSALPAMGLNNDNRAQVLLGSSPCSAGVPRDAETQRWASHAGVPF